MRPQEVLDHQADLLARLTNPLVRAAWRNQLEQDHVRHPGLNKVPEQIRANAAAMVASMTHNVRDAHAYHVNQDMSLMVEYAASQLDQLDRIDRSIAPTRNGMVRFERPLPFPDVRGRRMGVSWLVWGPVVVRTAARHDKGEPEEQMAIWMFNDHWTNPDEIADLLMKDPSLRPVLEATGRWGFIGNELLFQDQRLGPPFLAPHADHAAQILTEGDTPQEYTNMVRMVHAFWLLLGQTVTLSEDADLDRATRKRAGRAGLPARVTIIRLRRTETHRAEGESLVEWSHRWVVRGHWRWQVCSDHHPLAQEIKPGTWRCRIWIAPFVKGPQDRPLVVSEKVYALHR